MKNKYRTSLKQKQFFYDRMCAYRIEKEKYLEVWFCLLRQSRHGGEMIKVQVGRFDEISWFIIYNERKYRNNINIWYFYKHYCQNEKGR